ncbi:MAG: SPFH domain-containing protein, partial [Chloroflexi bacterium]|nr:SPFH domain-containing protein [Chloroflexota bacterium]
MTLLIIAILIGIVGFGAAVAALTEPKDRAAWAASAVGLLFVGFIVLAFSVIKTVNTGHVGVRVVFNDVKHGSVLPQGWHIVAPWVRVIGMNIRTQKFDMTPYVGNESGEGGGGPVRVLSKDAGQLTIDATVNFRLDPRFASQVYETLGPNYADVVFLPAVNPDGI